MNIPFIWITDWTRKPILLWNILDFIIVFTLQWSVSTIYKQAITHIKTKLKHFKLKNKDNKIDLCREIERLY